MSGASSANAWSAIARRAAYQASFRRPKKSTTDQLTAGQLSCSCQTRRARAARLQRAVPRDAQLDGPRLRELRRVNPSVQRDRRVVRAGHGGPAEDLAQPGLHLRPAAGRHQVAPGRLGAVLLGRAGGRPPQRLRVGGAAEAELRGEAGAGAEVGLAGLAVPGVPGVLGAVVLVVGGRGNVLAARAVLRVRDAGGTVGDGRRQQFAVEALAPARLADGLGPARLGAVEPETLVAAAEEREAWPPGEAVGDRRRLGGDLRAELGLVVHRAGEAEVLPDENALRVAAVIEGVTFRDPAAPHADRVGPGGERRRRSAAAWWQGRPGRAACRWGSS